MTTLTKSEQIAQDYNHIESVLAHEREQRESVAGKPTPIRVEFRFRGRTRHYQYFVDVESAKNAHSRTARYGPTGRAWIETPTSQQIQIQGPRGGWRKLP